MNELDQRDACAKLCTLLLTDFPNTLQCESMNYECVKIPRIHRK